MQPWLPNVKDFALGATEKMNEIIRGLVNTTIQEKDLYPSLQAKVCLPPLAWCTRQISYCHAPCHFPVSWSPC